MTYSDDTILDYIDGHLSSDEQLRIEASRQSDPQLEQRIQAFESLQNMLSRSVLKVAPEGLEESIISRLEQKSTTKLGSILLPGQSPLLTIGLIMIVASSILFCYNYFVSGQSSTSLLIVLFGALFTFVAMAVVDQYMIYNQIKKQVNALTMNP